MQTIKFQRFNYLDFLLKTNIEKTSSLPFAVVVGVTLEAAAVGPASVGSTPVVGPAGEPSVDPGPAAVGLEPAVSGPGLLV